MPEPRQSSFEGWAILELMGHQREIGYVTTEAYGTAVLFRVDTPDLPEREFVLAAPEWTNCHGNESWTQAGARVKRAACPARSRLVAPGALYALNPCTEEAARLALEKSIHRELILISAPPATAIGLLGRLHQAESEERAAEIVDEFEFDKEEDVDEEEDDVCRDHGI